MFTTQLRVRYAETDQMGVVYYANYLVWFEIGRIELLRSLGYDYNRLQLEHKLMIPVIEVNCRYRHPARYDDEILIEACPVLLRGPLLKFAYRILRKSPEGEEDKLLAEGETMHVICDENMKKRYLPENYAAALRAIMPADV
jgi:acyl-CoA thioester hydrolase